LETSVTPRRCADPRCARRGRPTCSSGGSIRGTATTPSAPGSRDTRRPAPRSCRRRRVRPPVRRRAWPRSATPSSGRSSLRTRAAPRSRAACRWRRSRSRACGRGCARRS
jgi:hypothetical protein